MLCPIYCKADASLLSAQLYLRRQKCSLLSCQRAYIMQGVEDLSRKETNPNPKWEVPMELIEWQPSYTQRGAVGIGGGAWSEDWAFTESTKCVHLLKRFYQIGAAIDAAQPESYLQRVCFHASWFCTRRPSPPKPCPMLLKAVLVTQASKQA